MSEASGEIEERIGKGLIRSGPEIDFHSREEEVATAHFVFESDPFHFRKLGKGGQDLLRTMGAQDEVDIFHDFHLSSQGAGEISPYHFGMGKDLFKDFLGGFDHFTIEISTLIFFDLSNALEDLLLGFLSESLEIKQSVFETGIFQFTNGFQIEPVIKGFDLLGPKAWDFKHLQMAWRDRVLKIFIKLKSTRGDQFGDVLR
jgi:hypothetical protein